MVVGGGCSAPRAKTWSRAYEPLNQFWSMGSLEYCQMEWVRQPAGS
ncbi:MAG: hypothetical protein ACRDTM_04440 [Micromonosporaceae bacterium]